MGKNYSLQGIIALYDNDMETIKQILQMFLDTSPNLWEELKESGKNNELQDVKEKAHSLKPTVELLEMGELKKEIKQIEHAAEQRNTAQLEILINKFDPVITEIFADIQEELNGM